MTSDVHGMVLEFHTKYGVSINQCMTSALCKLRWALIEEECAETGSALRSRNRREVADGLADLVYVAYGTAITFGIDLDSVIEAVHKSNMSKLGADGAPIYREDGKVLKGPNYRPPVITMGMLGVPSNPTGHGLPQDEVTS